MMKRQLALAVAACFLNGAAALAQNVTQEEHHSVNYGPGGASSYHEKSTSTDLGSRTNIHKTTVAPAYTGARISKTTVKHKNGLLGSKTKVRHTEINTDDPD